MTRRHAESARWGRRSSGCEGVHHEDGAQRIEIHMSMTAPGCGMGNVLCADARRAVERIPAVDHVKITLVFSCPGEPTA